MLELAFAIDQEAEYALIRLGARPLAYDLNKVQRPGFAQLEELLGLVHASGQHQFTSSRSRHVGAQAESPLQPQGTASGFAPLLNAYHEPR
jgi:hypothetical protein